MKLENSDDMYFDEFYQLISIKTKVGSKRVVKVVAY